jgi:hypothetical protein
MVKALSSSQEKKKRKKERKEERTFHVGQVILICRRATGRIFIYLRSLESLFFIFCEGLNAGLAKCLAKQVLYHLSHTSSPFCSGYFGDGVSPTICLGCP